VRRMISYPRLFSQLHVYHQTPRYPRVGSSVLELAFLPTTFLETGINPSSRLFQLSNLVAFVLIIVTLTSFHH